MKNLNNNTLYIYTSDFGSVWTVYEKLYGSDSSGSNIGYTRPQTCLNPPEPKPLEPLGVLDLGGFFF